MFCVVFNSESLCDPHLKINHCSFPRTLLREGGALPDGVTVVGGKLLFGRSLRMNDTGIYQCVVKNSVGVGKTEYTLAVTGKCVSLVGIDIILQLLIFR